MMAKKLAMSLLLSLSLLNCSSPKLMNKSQDLEKRLHFVVVGDTQGNNEQTKKLMKRVSELEDKPSFLLHAGDLVENAANKNEWKKFEEMRKLSGLRWYPTIGNHDCIPDTLPCGEKAIKDFFPYLPASWYSFERNGCYFISLNTQITNFKDQLDYLERNVNNFLHKGPIFVYFHKPIFSSSMDLKIPRTKMEKILRKGVDFVFSGHKHHYIKYKKLNGVNYIVSGGGSSIDKIGHKSQIEDKEFYENHYCDVLVKRDSVYFKAVDINGITRDSIAVNWKENNRKMGGGFFDFNFYRYRTFQILDEWF